jgi:Flp pilus assembly protein TadD
MPVMVSDTAGAEKAILYLMTAWKARQSRAAGLLSVILVLALTACATTRSPTLALAQITPLQFDGRAITVDEISTLAPTPDLLAVDDDMRAFVKTYTEELRSDRQRMHALHQSIKSNAILGVKYAPDAEGNAVDVFHRGTANCLSYAHLLVALAREAGLDANYQWVKVRPQWSRVGERVALRLHVNVTIKLRHGEKFTVDIDPLQPSETTGTRELSDKDAIALYHNNIGMEALARNEVETAWAHAVRALQLSPDMSLLWVNIGAIYRLAGQHEAAEHSYMYALQLNSFERSAMNNLVVLYDLEGREEESKYWSDRVARYRTNNPYYHAWLGDKAGETADWPQALMHYSDALRLSPEDSRLQYAVGLIHYQLGDFDESVSYISKAIDMAIEQGGTLRSEVARYQIKLDAVRDERLVSLH